MLYIFNSLVTQYIVIYLLKIFIKILIDNTLYMEKSLEWKINEISYDKKNFHVTKNKNNELKIIKDNTK